MKIRHSRTAAHILTAALFLIGSIGRAQDPAPKPGSVTPDDTKESSKLRDYLGRTLKFTGAVRIRWEASVGSDFAPTPADSYVISRARLGVAFKPSPWLRFFGEAQDSRVLFYKVTPSNTVSDPFEFRQGYVEAGALEGNGVKVRVGRQDLTFGEGRLVGTGDWSNITKSFDIARGTVTTRLFTMDVVAGSPVLADPARMDRHKPGEHFYVDYMTFKKLIPRASVDAYFMAKTALNVKSKDGKVGNADTLYAGGRVTGKAPRGIDYSFEGVREMGAYNNDAVRAWGYIAGTG
jgi:Alginate export